jgi:hypothetical protein
MQSPVLSLSSQGSDDKQELRDPSQQSFHGRFVKLRAGISKHLILALGARTSTLHPYAAVRFAANHLR